MSDKKLLLRLSVTAKEFGSKPSDYFPELGTYEKFCLDEACAHLLIHMRDEARKEVEQGAKARSAGLENREPVSKGPVSLDWMTQTQERFKQSGQYKL